MGPYNGNLEFLSLFCLSLVYLYIISHITVVECIIISSLYTLTVFLPVDILVNTLLLPLHIHVAKQSKRATYTYEASVP